MERWSRLGVIELEGSFGLAKVGSVDGDPNLGSDSQGVTVQVGSMRSPK